MSKLLDPKSRGYSFLKENKLAEKEAVVEWIMAKTLALGASEVAISTAFGHDFSATSRNREIDNFTHSISSDLAISIYLDGRYSSHFTNNLKKETLEPFLRQAVEQTKELERDEHRRLPDPETFYRGGEFEKVDQFDPSFPGGEQEDIFRFLLELESQLDNFETEKLIESSASFSHEALYSILAMSNGFLGYKARTHFSTSLTTTVRDKGESRPSGYDFEQGCFLSPVTDLLKDQTFSLPRTALKRSMDKLGQKPCATGSYRAVVENRVVGKLLSPLLGAISGRSLYEKKSFLLNKFDEKIFSEAFTLIDDPCEPRSLGAKLFNGEGQEMVLREIIGKGVLRESLIDSYYARRLGVKQTGAQLGNLSLSPGENSLEELLREMGEGIFIQGFNGGNHNPITGDFSYGVEGFLIEGGERRSPISEMNLTGNLIDLWSRLLLVGNDGMMNTARRFPSLLFDSLSFSGV